jgi:hypothetical protein
MQAGLLVILACSSFLSRSTSGLKGKFVAPLESRNDLRSSILLQFIKEAKAS